MTTEAKSKATTDIEKATDQITRALEECSTEAIQAMPQLVRALKLASGVRAMKTALTQQVVTELLMPLQGSPLGFRTDLDSKGGYAWETVRDCAIEAMVRGFNVVGNEFNIIASRAYFTKEGFERKVGELDGLTDLLLFPGVPKLNDGNGLVPYRATWKFHGKEMEIVRDLVRNEKGEAIGDERVPVRVNQGMGADGILGKAKRKILAQIYERVTGVRGVTDGDAIDTVGETVTEPTKTASAEKTDELLKKHQAKVAADKAAEKAKGNGAAPSSPPPANADPAADSSGYPEPGASG